MVLYSPDWTNIGFSFILLTVNLFRHPTLVEHGLYMIQKKIGSFHLGINYYYAGLSLNAILDYMEQCTRLSYI